MLLRIRQFLLHRFIGLGNYCGFLQRRRRTTSSGMFYCNFFFLHSHFSLLRFPLLFRFLLRLLLLMSTFQLLRRIISRRHSFNPRFVQWGRGEESGSWGFSSRLRHHHGLFHFRVPLLHRSEPGWKFVRIELQRTGWCGDYGGRRCGREVQRCWGRCHVCCGEAFFRGLRRNRDRRFRCVLLRECNLVCGRRGRGNFLWLMKESGRSLEMNATKLIFTLNRMTDWLIESILPKIIPIFEK